MLSFVEQLIKMSYNLNDLLWYSTAKQKILFLQDRSTLAHVLGMLSPLTWRRNVLMGLQVPGCCCSSIRG